GLQAMDYRLTDPYLDPPGESEQYYVEQSIHLPTTFWCYDPAAMESANLAVSAAPAIGHGFVTFGSLNNFCKVNDPLLSLWGKILAAVPRSRLLLHAEPGRYLEHALGELAKHGVERGRVEFIPRQPPADYFQSYQRIDILLDTLPYNGGTTTCDALWMGVPAVTMVGRTAVGRGGSSILNNLGLAELVAGNESEYVQIAVELAG